MKASTVHLHQESSSLQELVFHIREHSSLVSGREDAVRCLTEQLLKHANRWSSPLGNLAGYDYEQIALDSVEIFLTRYVFDPSVALDKEAAMLGLLKKIVLSRKISELRRSSIQNARKLRNEIVFSNDCFVDLENPASLCEHHEEFSRIVDHLQTDNQRRVFELRYTGYTIKEIAQQLKLTVNRVRAIRREIQRVLTDKLQNSNFK
jgi:DNA-directed RNA polymerase specialized sigma24 family protein